jgi:hypothetical protein
MTWQMTLFTQKLSTIFQNIPDMLIISINQFNLKIGCALTLHTMFMLLKILLILHFLYKNA